MGIPVDLRGTFLSSIASLAIHESQSRFWENIIGRSQAFWHRYLPELKKYFPTQLATVSPDEFYKAINKVLQSD
jgi:carboxypeptidase Taq